MDWIVNQIWLGNRPAPTQMQVTQALAEQHHWDYIRWDLDALTNFFGAYIFENFNAQNLTDQASALLVKYYMWYVLATSQGPAIFLDATRAIKPEYIPILETDNLEGVILGSKFNPGFTACISHQATVIACTQIRQLLDRRLQTLGDKVFDFLLKSGPNLIGSRFTFLTLLPNWKYAGITVQDIDVLAGVSSDSPKSKVLPPEKLLPKPVKKARAYPDSYNTNVRKTVASRINAVQPIFTVSTTTTKDTTQETGSKLSSITCLIDRSTQRVVIMGEETIGLTDPYMFIKGGDFVIHYNACPFLLETLNIDNTVNAAYYDSREALSKTAIANAPFLRFTTQLYPTASFKDFEWASAVTSRISPYIALACSYREKHPNTPVIIYGYNLTDDYAKGYDVELEVSLCERLRIEVHRPAYEILYLIFTTGKSQLRWYNATMTWIAKMKNTHHSWRFICAATENTTKPTVERVLPLPDAGDDGEALTSKKLYAAMHMAERMRFSYLYLCSDMAAPDPLQVWKIQRLNTFKAVGARKMDYIKEQLYFDLNQGACITRETFDTMLPRITASDTTTADDALATALHESKIALMEMPKE